MRRILLVALLLVLIGLALSYFAPPFRVVGI